MTYRKVNYTDIEPVSDAMHFLRKPLESRQIGVTISRCSPGWTSKPHDHTADGHEEIYVLISGEAVIRIDGEDVSVGGGDAVWIAPESTRQIRNGDTESAFVLVSAPELQAEDERDEWSLTGFQG
ncbi:MAG: cupin domain-containing protein [Halobacteriota archaeon]